MERGGTVYVDIFTRTILYNLLVNFEVFRFCKELNMTHDGIRMNTIFTGL